MKSKQMHLLSLLLQANLPEDLPLPAGFVTYAFAALENNLDRYEPDERLVSLIAETLPLIPGIHFSWADRIAFPANKWAVMWPGEHYKLLAALVQTLQPKKVFEIGTYSGMSCLAMKEYLTNGAHITTYDVCPWDELAIDPTQCPFQARDFDDKLTQKVQDLTVPSVQKAEKPLWEDADFIFIDAAKDGKMEYVFIDFLDSIAFNSPPLVIFDDIKLLCMLDIWNSIKHPKWDISSFGHWSGTGIVHWV